MAKKFLILVSMSIVLFAITQCKRDQPLVPETVVSGVRNVNGMLHFKDWDTFLKTMDNFKEEEEKLVSSQDREPKEGSNTANKSGNSNNDDIDTTDMGSPVLTAFENSLNFRSLRQIIIEEENKAFAQGTWSETNDPDNHFIADPYLRTVLNGLLEVKIGNEIVKYIDRYTLVRILDGDIEKLKKIRTNPEEVLCRNTKENENIAIVFINKDMYGGSPTPCTIPVNACKSYFYVDDQWTNQNHVYFVNASEAIGSSIESYYWDFGDGNEITTTTFTHPDHFYSYPGKFEVCLTVVGTCLNSPVTYCANIYVDVDCSNAGFIHETNVNSRLIEFTNKSTNNFNADYYVWDFGDGTTSTQTKNEYSDVVEHEYDDDGKYIVKLTLVHFDKTLCDDSEASYQITVIKNPKECCDYNDSEKIKYSEYAPCSADKGYRSIKSKLWSGNFLGIYNYYGASTVNYKRKNNNCDGKWVKESADLIYVSMYGYVYYNDCNLKVDLADLDQDVFDFDDVENNKSEAKVKGKWQNKVGLKNESLKSEHGARDHNSEIKVELKITNKDDFDELCE